MDLIYKIVIAALSLFIVVKYLAAPMMAFFPPFGLIIYFALIIIIILWLMGKF